MSMYIRETNGVVPISLDKHQLSIYGKLYDEQTLPGITADSSLKDIVKELLPRMSSVVLWINEDTKYGQEVIRDTQNSNLIGDLLISRYSAYSQLRVWSYTLSHVSIYLNTYYSASGTSWWGKWYQVQLKAVS